jgi:serine/threonine protein kinase/Leucine-rich repeat (LRR) protein
MPAPDTGGPDPGGATVPGPGPAAPAGFDFLAPPRSADELGLLGPYRVLGVLGHGGMGVVFRADDPRLRRQIALKVMLPRHATDPHARARFLREARAQAAVDHEHIIPVYEVDEDRGTPYIAMPLLKGMTLAAALKANPRPPVAEVVRVGREIAEGLAAAHEQGLIHRDVKPANVWLDGSRRRVKILDFGLARATDQTADPDNPTTARGAILGTPSHMSPEQAQAKTLDARTDLFSLGVVLYQMATGRLPFAAPTNMAVLMAVVSHDPPPPAELVPDLPPPLSELIVRLLAKDPAVRPPSAGAVADELAQIERGLAAVVPVVAIPLDPAAGPDPWAEIDVTEPNEVAHTPPTKPHRGSWVERWAWAGAVVLGLALVVGLAWAAYRSVTARDPKPVAKADEPKQPGPPPAPPPAPPTKPPPSDPDRRVAEWVLQVGGTMILTVKGAGEREVQAPEQLPTARFTFHTIRLNKESAVRDVDDAALDNLRGVTRLEVLYLQGHPVTDAGLERLATIPGLANIHHFSFSSPRVTGAGLAHLKAFRNLRSLNLRSETITDAALKHLRELPALSLMELFETGVTDAGMKHVRQFPALTTLSVWYSPLTDAGLEYLQGTKLQSLAVVNNTSMITPAGLKHLAGLPELIGLALVRVSISDEGVAQLKALPRLEWLDLQNNQVTDAGLEHLKGHTRLKWLDLKGNKKVTEGGVKKVAAELLQCKIIWDDGVIEPPDPDNKAAELLNRFIGLELGVAGKSVFVPSGKPLPAGPFTLWRVVTAPEASVDRELFLRAVAGLRSFSGIADYYDILKLRPADLTQLADLPAGASLQELSLPHLGLTPDLLPVLKRFPRLVYLFLDGTAADDALLERLAAELPKLDSLGLRGLGPGVGRRGATAVTGLKLGGLFLLCGPGRPLNREWYRLIAGMPELIRLKLAYSGVRDEDLAEIARCPKLSHLEIDQGEITDVGLSHLARLANLRKLELSQTKVTGDGVKKLATAMPQCKIIWDGVVIEPKP